MFLHLLPQSQLKEEPEPRLPVQVCVDGNESLKRLKNRGEADERAFDEPPYLSHERDVLPHKDEVSIPVFRQAWLAL